MHKTLVLMSLVFFITAPVFATDQDDPELGIEMKKSQRGVSVAETLDRSTTKLHHYQKAKDSVAEIFTGSPKKPGNEITLKNGQKLAGVIVDRDKNGVWVETDPGVKVYFKNDELKEETR